MKKSLKFVALVVLLDAFALYDAGTEQAFEGKDADTSLHSVDTHQTDDAQGADVDPAPLMATPKSSPTSVSRATPESSDSCGSKKTHAAVATSKSNISPKLETVAIAGTRTGTISNTELNFYELSLKTWVKTAEYETGCPTKGHFIATLSIVGSRLCCTLGTRTLVLDTKDLKLIRKYDQRSIDHTLPSSDDDNSDDDYGLDDIASNEPARGTYSVIIDCDDGRKVALSASEDVVDVYADDIAWRKLFSFKTHLKCKPEQRQGLVRKNRFVCYSAVDKYMCVYDLDGDLQQPQYIKLPGFPEARLDVRDCDENGNVFLAGDIKPGVYIGSNAAGVMNFNLKPPAKYADDALFHGGHLFVVVHERVEAGLLFPGKVMKYTGSFE